MAETISSFFLNIVFKAAFLAVVIGRWKTRAIGEGKLISIAKGSGSPAKRGDFVVVVGCGRDVVGVGEAVGFGEGVELLGAGGVER